MSRRKGKGQPQVKIDKRKDCVYCGELDKCTEEHVVPECLYPDNQKPTRDEFAIVPACGKCNGRKSADDSYMRDVLTVDIDCWGHPLAEKVQDKFYRSILKDKSIFAREALRDPRPIPIYTPNNIFLGIHQSVPLDQRRVDRFLRRVVQGLYWERYGVRIPNHYEFGAIRIRQGLYQQAYAH